MFDITNGQYTFFTVEYADTLFIKGQKVLSVCITIGPKENLTSLDQYELPSITGDGSLTGLRWGLEQLRELMKISQLPLMIQGCDYKRHKAFKYLQRLGFVEIKNALYWEYQPDIYIWYP